MKIILAPDSFKGSLSSAQVIEILNHSIEKNWGEQEVVKVPVADGGEGTAEALVVATHGFYRKERVTSGLGHPEEVAYGVIHDDTAVLEMALVAGLGQIRGDQLAPLAATSRGVGELLGKVIDAGYRQILIGIGGSMTNDGGMGLLSALGARFYDGSELLSGCGQDLERVTHIDLSQLRKDLESVDIKVICDVTNPLLGENGATYIYGPQKGATGEIRDRLEAGMANYAKVFHDELGIDMVSMSGAGAAGGVGAALGCVLGAKLCRGIDVILEAVRFDQLLEGADLVVTGEGRLDGQSIKFGKVPAGIAKRCAARGIPVAIIVGSLGDGWQGIYDLARCSVMTIMDAPMDIGHAMKEAKELLANAADRMFRFIRLI